MGLRDLMKAVYDRQLGISALQRAQVGLTSAGRGPFVVVPGGGAIQIFQCAGDTSFGRQHTITFDIDDHSTPIENASRSPLVAVVECGNDGTQGRFEVDVKRGTCISVPFGTVNVSVMNEGIVEDEHAPVDRLVSAYVTKYPFVRRYSATRTLRVPALAPVGDAPANISPPIPIPAYATDLTWIRGTIGSTFNVVVRWLDIGGTVIGVGDLNLSGYPVPLGAEFFQIDNQNEFAFDPSLAVFQISF